MQLRRTLMKTKIYLPYLHPHTPTPKNKTCNRFQVNKDYLPKHQHVGEEHKETRWRESYDKEPKDEVVCDCCVCSKHQCHTNTNFQSAANSVKTNLCVLRFLLNKCPSCWIAILSIKMQNQPRRVKLPDTVLLKINELVYKNYTI